MTLMSLYIHAMLGYVNWTEKEIVNMVTSYSSSFQQLWFQASVSSLADSLNKVSLISLT